VRMLEDAAKSRRCEVECVIGFSDRVPMQVSNEEEKGGPWKECGRRGLGYRYKRKARQVEWERKGRRKLATMYLIREVRAPTRVR